MLRHFEIVCNQLELQRQHEFFGKTKIEKNRRCSSEVKNLHNFEQKHHSIFFRKMFVEILLIVE